MGVLRKLGEIFLPFLFLKRECSHANEVHEITPVGSGCAKCIAMEDTWVHLRLCLACGHVGCCDNSKNKHATAHFHETGHPVIQSFQPKERWRYCYADDCDVPNPNKWMPTRPE